MSSRAQKVCGLGNNGIQTGVLWVYLARVVKRSSRTSSVKKSARPKTASLRQQKVPSNLSGMSSNTTATEKTGARWGDKRSHPIHSPCTERCGGFFYIKKPPRTCAIRGGGGCGPHGERGGNGAAVFIIAKTTHMARAWFSRDIVLLLSFLYVSRMYKEQAMLDQFYHMLMDFFV